VLKISWDKSFSIIKYLGKRILLILHRNETCSVLRAPAFLSKIPPLNWIYLDMLHWDRALQKDKDFHQLNWQKIGFHGRCFQECFLMYQFLSFHLRPNFYIPWIDYVWSPKIGCTWTENHSTNTSIWTRLTHSSPYYMESIPSNKDESLQQKPSNFETCQENIENKVNILLHHLETFPTKWKIFLNFLWSSNLCWNIWIQR